MATYLVPSGEVGPEPAHFHVLWGVGVVKAGDVLIAAEKCQAQQLWLIREGEGAPRWPLRVCRRFVCICARPTPHEQSSEAQPHREQEIDTLSLSYKSTTNSFFPGLDNLCRPSSAPALAI